MSGSEFVDLASSNNNTLKMQGDVCVVGAGAAGIYIAVQLAAKGLNVILVEAGNTDDSDASAVGFDAQFEAGLYPGATVGRSFGIGGSTSRWGGLLIPHSQHDLRDMSGGGFNSWLHIVQTVAAKADLVLARLGWRNGADFTAFAHQQLGGVSNSLGVAGFDVTASLFLPFRCKNLVYLLKQRPVRQSRLKVVYNAVAKSWLVDQGSKSDARLKQLLAVSSNGKQVAVSAPRFIIAAGAIESARILLELNELASPSVIRPGAETGRFLSDHLSLPIADVAPFSLDKAISIFAPRFVGGWMRGYRFIESDPPPNAPRAFLHFIFENMNPGFTMAREIMRALQGRRWPGLPVSAVASGMAGLLGLGYKKYFHSVLHIPSDTPTHLQLDIEQEAVRENWVALGAERDRYGRKVAKINWSISDRDIRNLHQTAQRVLHKWPGKKAGLPELLPIIDSSYGAKPHDAYHPVATCRMGEDMGAVVDKNMKVWGLANLWVVSTGVLPSAGTANPTFTMLCLAEGLVERLTANIDSARGCLM